MDTPNQQGGGILQICPHDTAPFGELCIAYQQAASLLGLQTTTVFLSAASSQPIANAEYLDCADLSDTKLICRLLRKYADSPWDMVLCHRYRAYWAVLRSPLRRNFCTVVAHEFGLMSRWQRRLARSVLARDVVFAGVSEPVAAELNPGVEDVPVLPNVLAEPNADNELLSRDDALKAMGLDPGPFTVGVVGRLHYKKRPQLALQAFQLFAAQHGNTRLVFVGAGDLAGDLEDQANVHMLNHVEGAAQLFRGFDVLLHPSQIEAFGMVVLEALYAGVPVVTLRRGGPGFVLDELGVYADDDSAQGFAAALHRATQVDLAALANAGRERVAQHFSVAALARSLGKLLDPSAR